MEGGGPRAASQDRLRRGMEVFLQELREAARASSWRWRLVCCGDRGRAFKAFEAEAKHGDAGLVVLLVDSEDPVTAGTFREHLGGRDGWDVRFRPGRQDSSHGPDDGNMDCRRQAGIGELLRRRVQDGSALPGMDDLEAASGVDKSLERATRSTKRGRYRKISHASDLLRRIDPETVRKRCPACRRLFETLAKEIGRR